MNKAFMLISIILVAGCTATTDQGTVIQDQEEVVIVGPTMELFLEEGSLPEGVSEDDINISLISIEDVPPEWGWLGGSSAFKLEPAGLVLLQPATFVITIPDNKFIPRFYHVENDEPVEISDINIMFDPTEKTTTVVGKISHFSSFITDTDWSKGTQTNPTLGQDYLTECAALAESVEEICSKKENWQLDIIISRTDWLDHTNNVLIEEFIVGKDNKCLGLKAGDSYPLSVNAQHLDSIQVEKISEETVGHLEVQCNVACYAWECPEGEAEQEQTYTCEPGSHRPDDCLFVCDSKRCVRDYTQYYCFVCNPCEAGLPLDLCNKNCGLTKGVCQEIGDLQDCYTCTHPECDLDAYVLCRDTYDFIGCIDACPSVDVDCAEVNLTGDNCTITEEDCSNACIDFATLHAETCADLNHCTIEEVDAAIRSGRI